MHKNRHFGGNKPPQTAARAPGGASNRNIAISVAPAIASALRIRNFRALFEVAGEENLSLALDMPLNRIREMLEGINFSNEIAFHIESTLLLTSGHMDQVNPTITVDTQNLLKSPLQMTNSSDIESESNVISFTTKESIVPTNTVVNKQIGIPTSFGSKMNKVTQATPSESNEIDTSSSAPATTSAASPAIAAAPQMSALAAEEKEVQVREIRKNNLTMLTQGIGAKTHLARITGLSPANISHRLHGNKHFDRDTADLFTSKLGLPLGWLDIAQTWEHVPLEVQNVLTGGTGKIARASKQKKHKSPVVAPAFAATVSPIQVQRVPSPAVVSSPPVRETVAANSAERNVTSNNAASILPLESATGLAPIAEALIKTIVGRARLGTLSEETAFKILQDVMSSK